MNQSAARSTWTVNGYEGEYRPVWAASWRPVRMKGRPVYFTTALAAEVAAWRVLYAVEQRVMKRDGETIYAAKSAITGRSLAQQAKFDEASRKLFLGGGKTVDVEVTGKERREARV